MVRIYEICFLLSLTVLVNFVHIYYVRTYLQLFWKELVKKLLVISPLQVELDAPFPIEKIHIYEKIRSTKKISPNPRGMFCWLPLRGCFLTESFAAAFNLIWRVFSVWDTYLGKNVLGPDRVFHLMQHIWYREYSNFLLDSQKRFDPTNGWDVWTRSQVEVGSCNRFPGKYYALLGTNLQWLQKFTDAFVQRFQYFDFWGSIVVWWRLASRIITTKEDIVDSEKSCHYIFSTGTMLSNIRMRNLRGPVVASRTEAKQQKSMTDICYWRGAGKRFRTLPCRSLYFSRETVLKLHYSVLLSAVVHAAAPGSEWSTWDRKVFSLQEIWKSISSTCFIRLPTTAVASLW